MLAVSNNFSKEGSHTLEIAKANGIYDNLKEIFSMDPQSIRDEVFKSGLRGKGGGGSSTGSKWNMMPKAGTAKSYLVVNADESEPGTFKDRYILAYDPHLLIEGTIISSYALGVNEAYIYIRGEYIFEYDRLLSAINEAYKNNILGSNILGLNYDLDLTLHRGAGAYICGEKTALLESLEGKRGHPRLKPHIPSTDFLYGKSCVVNNVETIATVPFILKNTYNAYLSMGTEKSPGCMIFGASGHINKPCIKEIEFGMPMMDFINNIAGGVWKNRDLKAVIPGGSSCKILTKEEAYNVKLDYESMNEFGTYLGTGGMIVMDETTDMVHALENLLDFYKEESCGQCTPCREGTGWSFNIAKKILRGEGKVKDLDILLEISEYMNGKTICVFAPAVSDVIVGFVQKFKEEFYNFIKRG